MLSSALNNATSGAIVQSEAVRNISQNIANINTTAYKQGFLTSTDLLYSTAMRPGAPVTQGSELVSPVGIQYGNGAAVSAIVKDFSQGALESTGSDFDVAVRGEGFLIVTLPDGTRAYTRDGHLTLDANTGQLVTISGYAVEAGITVPPGYLKDRKLIIKQDGGVYVVMPGTDNIPEQVGQITTATFLNNAGLEAIGNNLYLTTDASGNAQEGIPGEDDRGSIMQGYLEKSNVQVITEMVNLINAQKAFDMNLRVIKTVDEMQKKVTEA